MRTQARWALGAFLAVVLALSTVLSTPASAATGDTPEEARTLEINGDTIFGVMPAGASPYWFKIDYPGSDRPLGVTMQVVGGDKETTERVNLTVNIKTRFFRADGEDWDYPGYSRIGLATTTGDSGIDRKFWFNTSGESDTYYLRLTNANNHPVTVAIIVSEQREIAGSVGGAPANVAPFSEPEPTPAPVPTAAPEPTVVPEPEPAPEPEPETDEVSEPEAPVAPAAGELLVIGPGGAMQAIEPSTDPRSAVGLDNDDVVVAGVIPAGTAYWFRTHYPGRGLPLGVTLQTTDDAAERNALDMFVNIRLIPDETLGEPNVDWDGYSRIGTLMSGEYTSGPQRKYWLNFSGSDDTYWLRLYNHSAQAEPFAFAIRQNDSAAILDAYLFNVQQGWAEAPAQTD